MSTPFRPTRTYEQFTAVTPLKARVRDGVRAMAIRALGLGSNLRSSGNGLRFPFYHHVFEDERRGFESQIDLLQDYGDFISMDDAVGLLESETPIDGRYYCLSFDDGLKSCYTGALPVLAARAIPAIFYLVTNQIGNSLAADDPGARAVFNFKGKDTTLDFLSWEDCREMAANGMTFGSHTCNHVVLASSNSNTARREMQESKETIEQELGKCDHFCPPYGIPGHHYDPLRDPGIARACGYRSLVSGVRGVNQSGGDLFAVRRDQLLANWGTYQLEYFLSRN